MNPGPVGLGEEPGNSTERKKKAPLQVTTLNVRGLKDESKLRHILNFFKKSTSDKNKDVIICLQETYLEVNGKLPYIWRGNFHLTPGIGNSGGCITLLSSHLNVVSSRNFGNRGHVLACQKSGDTSVSFIVTNVYAPNPNTAVKIDFFNEVFDTLSEFEETHLCPNLIVAGDFNLAFAPHEMKNRLYPAQEKRVAAVVKDMMDKANLKDMWSEARGFTWKRANSDSFSTIDRILFSQAFVELKYHSVNWALSASDHAAIEAGFTYCSREEKVRSKIPRIDPNLAKNPETRTQLYNEVDEMMKGLPQGWDPHMKLEFLKVCTRTVAEKIQAERKRKDKLEEETLDEELNEAITILTEANLTENRTNSLIDKVEELRTRKAILIEEKGIKLAERLGSKWYNEGEKSTRYFMRLLNRPISDDFESILKDDGTTVTEPEQVTAEIQDYYRKLYEDFQAPEARDDDDFFSYISGISRNEEQELVAPITSEELRTTLHSCSDSAPGPDGIPYSIIGLLWPLFGPLLSDAWNHSLKTGKLPPSHKQSYLKLIPKAGKDVRKLTNWRPISLSKCDHKLITKSYSKRLSEKVSNLIEENQTAYIKGRLINDNIRSINATARIANEEGLSGLLVALDAKKAFDSVSHDYIERCFEKFGCKAFIPIFRTLYSELRTDIIINGKIVRGFLVKRGVKQGDALSCIIFIMCMEPLLRNIKENAEIKPIVSNVLQTALP